jgi:hypothetical protein
MPTISLPNGSSEFKATQFIAWIVEIIQAILLFSGR